MLAIHLKQLKNGKWAACGPALKYSSVIIEKDTPDAAFNAATKFLDEYELFLDHLYGCCDEETCQTCKSDKEAGRDVRGFRTGNRPKRYNAK